MNEFDIPKVFIFNAIKKILFRFEHDRYYYFDPEGLEYYQVNMVGAKILYMLSTDNSLEAIAKNLAEIYNIAYEEMYEDTINFIRAYPLLKQIFANLIISGVAYEL